MMRHALSALFSPESLVVVSQHPLPLEHSLSDKLRAATTYATWKADGTPELATLTGVAPGGRPDLALVWVKTESLMQTLQTLAGVRPRAMLLYTLVDVPELTAACQQWSRDHDCALVGPHTFGMQRPHLGLNASLHPTLERAGRVALVAQSREIMAGVMDWADDNRTAFSLAISSGDANTVGLPAVLEFLASDAHTESIALYLEHVDNSREFMSALRAAASAKPVVVLKTGRTEPAPSAMAVPPDTAFDAALRRAGALRVHYFLQLFSTIKALSQFNRPRGQRVALFANGRGQARLAQDLMAQQHSLTSAAISTETQNLLRATLSSAATLQKAVIEPAPLNGKIVAQTLQHLLADAGVDGIVVLLTPDPQSKLDEVIDELGRIVPQARKPIVTCLMGDASMRRLRSRLAEAGVPSFRTPETATDAFGQLARFHYNQQLLLQTQPPESLAEPVDLAGATNAITAARASGERTLNDAALARLLTAFRIPIVPADAGDTLSDDVVTARIRVTRDRLFGPVISLDSAGAWPTASSAGVELVPLNGFLARRLIERSPLWSHQLAQQATSVALEKLEDMLIAVADLAAALPDIESITLEPVSLTDSDAIVRHAGITITAEPAQSSGRHQHLAIAPYPRQWVRHLQFEDETPWVLRPIRPEDAEPLQNFIRGLSDHSRYMRFISALRELPPRMLSRYTQIDYHREVALVATVQQPNPLHRGHPHEVIIGLAHYLRNADGVGAEYALVISDDWQRRRLGPTLMKALIAAAREQGLAYIEGVVLGTNRPMIKLMTSLGFTNERYPDDPSMRRIWLPLTAEAVSA
nr:GNAT family N-acetyltransferase [Pseudomonas sp.]